MTIAMDTILPDDDDLSDVAAAPAARKVIQAEMMKFVEPDSVRGFTLFAIDYAIYFAALAGVLFLAPLWAKILCSVLAGVKIANLVALAHEAAHGSLVKGQRFNKYLSTLAFMPALFNYELWVYDHHVLHHRKMNSKMRDSFTPFSKAEYDALPFHRRLLERVYRAPAGLGLGLYQLIERWTVVKLIPKAFMPQRVRSAAWPHFFFLMGYAVLFLAALALAPFYSPTDTLTAISLGFVLPYYIWMMLIGFTLYVQHTHPSIPWFDYEVDRNEAAPPEVITAHLYFPSWLSSLMHNVYDHAAHHIQPRIPCYRLEAAQARLNELAGARAVSSRFTAAWFVDTVRRCKLYDYENHRWLDFKGRPTTERLFVEPGNTAAAE